ncbi:MAG: hypothetical protein AB4368_25570 [Xenococcaceae cyanobacterium]
MKLSHLLNLAQKIGVFTLIYFFSSSSYRAQIVTAENLANNSSADSVNSVCNKDITLLNDFDTFAFSTNTLAMFEGEVQAAANLVLGEYLQLSCVLASLQQFSPP